MSWRILSLLIILMAVSPVQGDWLRLQDGEIVRLLERRGDRAKIRRADGTETVAAWGEVDGVLTDSQARRLVDDVLAKMRESAEHHETIKKTLKQIGPAAVPTLLERWKGARSGFERAVVMACFQFVWSAEAKETVIDGLTDADAQVRTMAKNALTNHVSPRERVEIFREHAGEADPEVAAIALADELLKRPDADRLREGLETREGRKALAPLVARYHDPAAWQASVEALLEGSEPEEVANALLAATYQGNTTPFLKAKVTRGLDHDAARIRDLAAEYFRWCGEISDRPRLEGRLAAETDPWVKASIEAALEAIARRAEVDASDTSANQTERVVEMAPTLPLLEKLSALESRFKNNRTESARREVRGRLAEWIPVAPYHRHGFVNELLPPDVERAARIHAHLLNDVVLPPKAGAAGGPEVDASPAGALQVPVRDYWDPERKSFGVVVDPKKYAGEPFQGQVHVGDDVAWHLPGSTVVAIGNGVVRLVSTMAGSWGGLVVIEHRRADGSRFCSVYGHLAPALCVEAGTVVRRGQKVGSLGRDWTCENGGFAAHLHFGIYNGAYTRRVLAGYLSPAVFEEESGGGWVDPQAFIRAYGD